MSIYDEEVVNLVFGDNPPADWRENEELLTYLAELGSLGADRLTIEPERVTEELNTVQSSTQELAFSNYKTFIQTSDCSKQIYNELATTEQHLQNLTTQMPGFLEKCEQFKTVAADISTHRRLTSLTLSKHTSLLEILELPQLMDTVVRNQHYDEALELHAYVTKLWKKHPEVKILEDISRNVTNSIKLMLQQLLALLRAPIQLPQCLKVISYLRRMDIFEESELRLKFLQVRETWLQSVTNAVPRDDPYIHITRTMEVMRVHLFDIVTQYRAIFSDDSIMLDTPTQPCDNRLLFSSWLSRKIQEFLNILESDLEHDIGSIESLLGQAMYFGLSFSRVGYDFRPQLVPIFETAILKQLDRTLNFDANVKLLTDSFQALNLVKIGGMPLSYHQHKEDLSQPPLVLIDFPPLAHACNIILAGLNHIRLCAPLSIAGQVTARVAAFLHACVQLILKFRQSGHASWRDTEVLGFRALCGTLRSLLLPYVQACLSAVFPAQMLSNICGFSIADLQTKQLGFIKFDEICQPLEEFMPAEPEEENCKEKAEEMLRNGIGEASSETEYVADRMAELAVAVSTTESNDIQSNGVEESADDTENKHNQAAEPTYEAVDVTKETNEVAQEDSSAVNEEDVESSSIDNQDVPPKV